MIVTVTVQEAQMSEISGPLGVTMEMDIAPWTEAHIPAATLLLAAKYREERGAVPTRAVHIMDPSRAEESLWSLVAHPATRGVSAWRDGRMTGYLLGRVLLPEPTSMFALFFPPRAAIMSSVGHALAPEAPRATYHDLYAALASHWLADGCFVHTITVAAGDRRVLDAWFSSASQRPAYGGSRRSRVDLSAFARHIGS